MRFLLLILLVCSGMGGGSARAAIAPVVAELKKRVEERSPDIAGARATLDQKSAQLHTAWARWLPRVDLQLSQTDGKDYSFLTNGAITLPPGFPSFNPQEVRLSGWTVKASLPLFHRAVYLQVEQSVQEKRAAERRLDSLLAELDWRMRELLGNYLLQAYKVATLGNSLQMARANQRESKLRFDLGQRTRIDVLRSDANVLLLESKQLTYQQEKTNDWNAIREFSGLNQEELDTLGLERMLTSEDAIETVIEDFAQAEASLAAVDPFLRASDRESLAKRVADASPAYFAIDADTQVAEAQAESLMATEWPQLDAQGSIYKQATSWNAAFSPGEQSFSVGITLTIPLFIGGSLYSTARERAEARRSARLRQEKDRLHLRNEVESEWLELGVLQRTLQSAQASLEQNKELVRLSLRSYDLGKTTMLELLSAQNDLIDAKITHAKTRIDLSVLARRFAANLGVPVP